jgi:hypothetical protein
MYSSKMKTVIGRQYEIQKMSLYSLIDETRVESNKLSYQKIPGSNPGWVSY